MLSRRTLLLFFKSWAVTSTASSEWQPNTMTWRHLPVTVLSEYGTLPADRRSLHFPPILCHQTSWNLQDPVGSKQWYNVRRPGHACIHSKQNVPGADMATPERSHEERTVLKCWNCEEAQRESNYKDRSYVKRKRSNVDGSISAPKTCWTQHWLRTGYTPYPRGPQWQQLLI